MELQILVEIVGEMVRHHAEKLGIDLQDGAAVVRLMEGLLDLPSKASMSGGVISNALEAASEPAVKRLTEAWLHFIKAHVHCEKERFFSEHILEVLADPETPEEMSLLLYCAGEKSIADLAFRDAILLVILRRGAAKHAGAR